MANDEAMEFLQNLHGPYSSMKVALVLTGLLRKWEDAYPVFKHCFVEKWNADVFIDIWDEVGWYTGKGYTHGPNDTFISTSADDKGFHAGQKVRVDELIEYYNPISIRVERFDTKEAEFIERAKHFVNAYTRPKNSISQAYKIQQGVRSVPYGYDIIVRARPDVVLDHDPTYVDLQEIIDKNIVYTLPGKNKMGTGTGDSFMIASASTMRLFADVQYEYLEHIYNIRQVSCPHIFVEETLTHVLPRRLSGFTAQLRELNVGFHITHSPSGISYAEPDA